MGHDRTIESIARGVLVIDGAILLCHAPHKGHAYLPGGHVDFAEPAAHALAREFKEETGRDCRVGRPLLANECVFTSGGTTHHEWNILFHVEHLEGVQTRADLEKVESIEPKLAFRAVDLAAIHETDLRPEPIKAWIMAGMTPTTQTLGWIADPRA